MITTGNLIGKNIDQFRLEELVGQGGMGTVYKAYDTVLHRTVALKLIPKDSESSTQEQVEISKRLIQEAQAAGCLSQPNIVTIHAYGETDEYQYICMEYIRGRTLGDMLRQKHILSVEDAAVILEQILLALDAAHQHHIVHRDIKPNNIMVSGDLKAKVMDFGIAKLPSLYKTTTGTVLGTPYYMSPEQISGHAVDIRSDLFSVGTLFYQMITGERPFDGDTTVVVAYKITQVEPVPPKVLNIHIPQAIENICRKALAKDPALRYQTPDEMLQDLNGTMGKGAKIKPEIMEEKTIVSKAPIATPQVQKVKNAENTPVSGSSLEEVIIPNKREQAEAIEKPKDEAVKPAGQSPGQNRQAPGNKKESANKTWPIAFGLIIVIVIGVVMVFNLLKKSSGQNTVASVTTQNAGPANVQLKPIDINSNVQVVAPADIKTMSAKQNVPVQGSGTAKIQTRQPDKQTYSQLKSIILQAKEKMQSNPANARKLLEQALALDPYNFEANFQMARLMALQNDFPNAILFYQKAGQIDKKAPEIPFSLGAIYMIQGNYVEALNSYKVCQTLSPPFQEEKLVFKDGIHRVRNERALSRALQEEVSINMGICYLKTKNAKRARMHFNEALKLNPKNSVARGNLKSMGR